MKRFLTLALVLFLISGCAAPEWENVVPEEPTPSAEAVERPPTAIERLSGLEAEDIFRITGHDTPDADVLAKTLSAAMEHRTTRSEPIHSCWSVTAYLSENYSSGDEHFIAYAGPEDNIVQITYTDPTGYSVELYAEDGGLYWLIRNSYKSTGSIDLDYENYGHFIEEMARESVEAYREKTAGTPNSGFKDFEVISFESVDTFETESGKYELFDFSVAYIADDPEKVIMAGGMYLDSEMRVRGFDSVSYLAVGGNECRFLSYEIFSGADEESRRANAIAAIEAAFAENQ